MDGDEHKALRRAVAGRLRAFDRRVSRTESEQSQMTKLVTDLKHTVWGNGGPGLDKRVDRLEQAKLSDKEAAELTKAKDDSFSAKVASWATLASFGAYVLFSIIEKWWK